MMFATNATKNWFSVEKLKGGFNLVFDGDTHIVRVPVSLSQLSEIIKIINHESKR